MTSIAKHTLDYLDSWLQLRTIWSDAPGMTVAIRQHGKTIFTRSYGYANKENNEAMSPSHLFQVASQSKTFTATAVFQLQEKGLLRIDDPIVQYVPWLDGHSDNRWKTVTIRQLLSHSAGIVRDGQEADYWQLLTPFPSEDTLKHEVKMSRLILEPNTSMKYSNLGYALLGELISRVSGQSYDEYIRQHILQKLSLQNCYVDVPEANKVKLATGYTRMIEPGDCRPLPRKSAKALIPATGYWSTAEDLAIYYDAHMVGSGLLLSDESKREMQRLQWRINGAHSSYGLGFLIEEYGRHAVVGHGGGFPGFVTRGVIDADSQLSIVVLTNSNGGAADNTIANIFSLIDLLGDHTPDAKEQKLEGRFVDLSGVVDVVSTSDGFVELFPTVWSVADETTKLEKIDDSTLKFVDANGFYNNQEHITYSFDDTGKVARITRGGMTMWPSGDGRLNMEQYSL